MRSRHLSQSVGLSTLLLAALVFAGAARAEPPAQQAPQPVYRHAPVSLWLLPNVATDGVTTDRLKTNFALSLGASSYAVLEGMDVGVGASLVTETMHGGQLTVGFNYVGADAVGAQLTVGANVVAQRMTGLQSSVGFNFAGADVRGVQLTVGANVARGQVSGLQVSSGVNYGPSLAGAQIGLVNIGGDVAGAQVGLVNVGGRVRGTQIGLLNVAEDSAAPVGLLNFVAKGEQHAEVWGTDAVPLNVGVKLGSKHVYSVLAAGFETSGGKRRWLAGLGIGGHLPLGERFYLEGDLITWHVNEDRLWSFDTNSLHTLRIVGGYRLYRHLSIFGGATANLLATQVGDREGFGLIRGVRLSSEGSATTFRAWPGFVGGVQF